ncbi:MAG: 4Fe-4S binding protein [Clostridiales Family XIII bacterium]|jgi:2-oxoglutarate ferredoxin oxidoreductase subunit delta|nr:4Fe-4S binding protein [Clostridiales Family XIII bacterium]
MSIPTIDNERCKSCGLCIAHCPKGALSLSKMAGKTGYRAVELDAEKCIGCTICYTMCPDVVFEFE